MKVVVVGFVGEQSGRRREKRKWMPRTVQNSEWRTGRESQGENQPDSWVLRDTVIATPLVGEGGVLHDLGLLASALGLVPFFAERGFALSHF